MRRVVRVAGRAVALAALLAGSALASDGWEEFSSPGGRFRIELPGAPEHERDERFTPAGSVHEAKWWLEVDDAVLAVETHDVPALAAALMSDAMILDQARDGVIENEGGTPIASREITVQGAPARAFTYRVPAREGKPALRERALSVLVGNRLYLLTGTTGAPEAHPAVTRFFASFSWLDEHGAPGR